MLFAGYGRTAVRLTRSLCAPAERPQSIVATVASEDGPACRRSAV